MLRWFSLCLFALLLVACDEQQSSFSYLDLKGYTDSASQELKNTPLTSAAIAKDVDLLIYALDHGYSGRLRISPSIYSKLLQDLRALKSDKRVIDSKSLAESVSKAFSQLPDAHISVWPVPSDQPNKKADSEDQDSSSTKSLNQAQQRFWFLSTDDVEGESLVNLRITSFVGHSHSGWRNFLPSVKRALAGSSAMVLDMRGNGGGDSTFGGKLIAMLAGGHSHGMGNKLLYATAESATLHCQLAEALMYSGDECGQALTEIQGGNVTPYLRSYTGEGDQCDFVELEPHLWSCRSAEESKPFYFDRAKAYNRPLFVLVDHQCASSCELTVHDAKASYPYTIVVGTSTGGYLQYGDLGAFVLPHSKLGVNIPTVIFDYYPGYKDKVGIPPDVYVKPGEDALEVAKDLFKHMRLPGRPGQ